MTYNNKNLQNVIFNNWKNFLLEIYYNKSFDIFCKKHNINNDPDNLDYLGKGHFGEAYLIKDLNQVLKRTSSETEFKIAEEIKKSSDQNPNSYSSFAKIYLTDKIENDKYILLEYLEEDSEIEDLFYQLNDLLDSQGLSIPYIGYLDEDELEEPLSDEMKQFIQDIWNIVDDYKKLGIEAVDIHPENLGRSNIKDPDTDHYPVKAFDIDTKLDSF